MDCETCHYITGEKAAVEVLALCESQMPRLGQASRLSVVVCQLDPSSVMKNLLPWLLGVLLVPSGSGPP